MDDNPFGNADLTIHAVFLCFFSSYRVFYSGKWTYVHRTKALFVNQITTSQWRVENDAQALHLTAIPLFSVVERLSSVYIGLRR